MPDTTCVPGCLGSNQIQPMLFIYILVELHLRYLAQSAVVSLFLFLFHFQGAPDEEEGDSALLEVVEA